MRSTEQKERLIDAVERCFARSGIEKTSMSDVAGEAGVSRQTVYRTFKGRSSLLRAVVLRTVDRHWRAVSVLCGDCETLQEWLVQAIIHCVEEIPTEPQHLLMKQLRAYDEGMAVVLTDEGLEPAIRAMRPHYEKALRQQLIKPGLTITLMAEWLYRIIHSYIVLPTNRLTSEQSLREWLGTAVIAAFFVASPIQTTRQGQRSSRHRK